MNVKANVGVLAVVFGFAVAAKAETWNMTHPWVWAREASNVTFAVRADGAAELRHTGAQDWAVNGFKSIDVRPGDVFRLSCSSESLADAPGASPFSFGVILRDAKGDVLNWCYGSKSAKPGRSVVTSFMVPSGVARIDPRLIGDGRTGVVLRDAKVERLGNRMPATPPATETAETDSLRVEVSGADGALAVTDRRTGRRWSPLAGKVGLVAMELSRAGRAICATLVDPNTLLELKVFVSPVPTRPEVLVTVAGEGEMRSDIAYPAAFATRKGDRLIVPMNEGISYPVEERDGMPWRLSTYAGHGGLSMPFFGVQDDATGAGWMALVETPDDAAAIFSRGAEGFASTGVSWEAQKGRFGYPRRVRYAFFDKGGYVAMCKRYRADAQARGLVKTFAEKAKTRPLVDRLLGAPNVWSWTADQVGMAKKLKAAGIDRFLWSNGGSPGQVAEIAKMEGVLVSRYDVYRDIYRPEQLKALGWKSGNNMDAWPDGAAWDGETPDTWRKAWGVKDKNGEWTYCACMCDATSAKYCRKHVSEELRASPYNTRFIDVTTAAAWDTCSNPAHPMTRSDSRRYRMDLLRLLGDDFGLVVGSETGLDAAVPYCDYFEGMLSLCSYRVPDSGRNIREVWTNVPPNVAKFQVGAAYRLPLWELVYHDCICSHWYWGDYNNKLPSLWDRRDLFNVLYGTMGMFFVDAQQWETHEERFVRSYRMTSPVARQTGYSKMLDHRILSPDRLVQRTVFADGTVVTVNFGDRPFALPEGGTIAAGAHSVKRGIVKRP